MPTRTTSVHKKADAKTSYRKSQTEVALFFDQVVNSFEDQDPTLRDRREFQRYQVAIPVEIVPLKEDLTPLNLSLDGLSTNVSQTGAGILMMSPIQEAQHAILTFHPKFASEFKVLCRVIRCDEEDASYTAGFEFVV